MNFPMIDITRQLYANINDHYTIYLTYSNFIYFNYFFLINFNKYSSYKIKESNTNDKVYLRDITQHLLNKITLLPPLLQHDVMNVMTTT